MGRKKRPFYRIIAIDSRSRRDGAFIDRLGYYHPLNDPPAVEIDASKALKWLRVGAQPSETVLSLLRREGIWLRFRLEARGLPEAQIEQMMGEWYAANAKQRSELEAKAVEKAAAKQATPVAETDVESEPVSVQAEAPVVEAESAVEASEVQDTGEEQTEKAPEAKSEAGE